MRLSTGGGVCLSTEWGACAYLLSRGDVRLSTEGSVCLSAEWGGLGLIY